MLLVESRREVDEVRELLGIAREYAVALRIEIKRKEYKAGWFCSLSSLSSLSLLDVLWSYISRLYILSLLSLPPLSLIPASFLALLSPFSLLSALNKLSTHVEYPPPPPYATDSASASTLKVSQALISVDCLF
jgi:hypothetical protein